MKHCLLLLVSFLSLISSGQNQKKVDSLLVELIKTKNDTIEVDVLNKIFKEYY
jgi:hypothetical protein